MAQKSSDASAFNPYAYDAFNQRVTEYGPGGVRVDTLGELLQLTTPPSGKGSMTYAVYVEGERVAELTQDYEGTWTRRYLNSDQVGSSLAWSDDSGTRHDAAVTEPFGAVMSGSSSEQRFGSHPFDAALFVEELPSGAVLLTARQHLGPIWGHPVFVPSAVRAAQRRVLNFFGGDGQRVAIAGREFPSGNFVVNLTDVFISLVPRTGHLMQLSGPVLENGQCEPPPAWFSGRAGA